jgi:predicted lipoprotein with Yx(FWY)xxD motif
LFRRINRATVRAGGLGWLRRATAVTAIGAAAALASAGVAAAQPAPAAHSKSAVVVKEAKRHHFGKILVTPKAGAALYVLPHGSCNSGCLSVWPRLVMPKGKTVPKGAPCLGTASFGTHHRLQVTYHGKRLYTFTGDSGHSVNGNGVMGFKVAKVTACM